jgi:enediyne biosynthesis protein E4
MPGWSRRALSAGVAAALLVGLVAWATAGRRPRGATAAPTSKKVPATAPGRVLFTDITKEAGLDFRQYHGGCGMNYFVEQVASGVAFLDANGDGRLDLYFPQPKAIGACKPAEPLRQRLYLGDGKGRFRLDANAFGGKDTGYAIGASAADYDNDGDADLFVTCWGPDVLYQNDGNGRFTDVSRQAGVDHAGFSTSSAWLDYDRDGDLDLYSATYAHYLLADNIVCKDPDGKIDVCTPTTYPPAANVLYRNNGDGTFKDVTVPSGTLIEDRRSLGIAAADYDRDGWVDLFVANDLSPNSLLRNQRNGTFRDVAMQQAAALGADGGAQANMGLAVGDYDRDADLDVLVTVFSNEPKTLYRNEGGYFTDQSEASGIGPATLVPLAFGTFFFDADNDGFEDLFLANGHVSPGVSKLYGNMSYAQTNQLLMNDGQGGFQDASAFLPPVKLVHRGCAYGDIDADGDLDVVVTANDESPTLLRNDSPRRSWLRVRLVGRNGNVSPIGSTCFVEAGKDKQLRAVLGGGSYASQSEYTLHFGMGDAATADRVTVRWPSGKTETLRNVRTRAAITVREKR